jgi:hypothetical protein
MQNLKPNLVEITRFEAFALYKHYRTKMQEAQNEGILTLAEGHAEEAKKWLDIACDIEQADADGINKVLIHS